jgi:hypothetical protein
VPIDERMDGRFERRPVPIGDTPGKQATPQAAAQEGSDIDRTFARLSEAARNRDDGAFRAAAQDHARSDAGQAWLQTGREQYQQMKAEQAQAAPQQPTQPPPAQQQPPPQQEPPSAHPRAPGL